MTNTFTNIVDKIFAMGLVALRENAIMPRLVNTDWGTEVASEGQTITVPIPSAATVASVTPGPTPPAGGDSVPTKTDITLDQWKKSDMHVTDKEAREIAQSATSVQVSEHIKALANSVDAYILGLYPGIYGYTGTPGTTPFASTLGDAAQARRILGEQLAPVTDRRVVLDPAAEANALLLRAIQDASFRANQDNTLRSGFIGTVLGFDWYMDQNIPSLTSGTLTDGTGHRALVDNAAVAVGDESCDFDAVSLSGTVKAGEVFTVAGDSQTYVVTADATAAANAITLAFSPPAKVAWADDAQMTLKGAASAVSPQSLAFHRDAFALAVRPLAPADGFSGGNVIRTGVDPVSGLALTLEVSREYFRTKYSWSILYGAKLVRAELAARIAG